MLAKSLKNSKINHTKCKQFPMSYILNNKKSLRYELNIKMFYNLLRYYKTNVGYYFAGLNLSYLKCCF